jgi:hypothetical protein
MMEPKYYPIGKGKRKTDPNKWISGPDPIEHDKYYAWQKHRAQARFRGEEHYLTWEEWQQLWPTDLFLQRGRTRGCYSLIRLDPYEAWHINNVEVVTSQYHHQTQKARLA